MLHIFILSLILLIGAPSIAQTQIVIDDFQSNRVEKFPDSWRTFPFQYKKAKKVHSINQDGKNKFIAAEDNENISMQIFKKFNWDLNDYPKLKFRWRAKKLPAGADERHGETNDSACGVYVLFDQWKREAIKYVWSTGAPVGFEYKKPDHNMFFVVKDSGDKNLGKWQTHTIDVKADYQHFFKGRDLDKPIGIGILTDGNAVGKPAACDYDDFVMLK